MSFIRISLELDVVVLKRKKKQILISLAHFMFSPHINNFFVDVLCICLLVSKLHSILGFPIYLWIGLLFQIGIHIESYLGVNNLT